MPETQEPISVKDFANRVKAKYPEYKDIDDTILAKKMVEKYPEYKDQVSFEVIKKKRTYTFRIFGWYITIARGL